MNYYIELTLMDGPEFLWFELWSKLYTQLHIAFTEHKNEQEKVPFGLSFPQYRLNEKKKIWLLGAKVRIFAQTENELYQLNLGKWLERLTDYVHITQIRKVPKDKITGYSNYYRINRKMDLEKRIKHQAIRRNISISEAQQHFKQYIEQLNQVPYINLKSLSAQRKYNIDQFYQLHIGKSIVTEPKIGGFGTYGLSRSCTVPEF
ncbi:type I-F CRISPR-associated endoribonuclease Cas6/Csy4 [Acinetobacter sp. B5B]|uniref:type I-F CRISPR-associated endoribonuclease Cas6/Csy4 n=1 Tax=Acinetobacter baretiae TaxID=2605383 RepID=UPI0018C331C3|nr:type I-F CRISPR-associated endoribonuclease Cas6/Csy4 [Acinetobacter baretiae]MBF7683165.1 type I-F CRISPR-associated endoribonuclease Cas6/Csy4 [Acinetobacter baretiae]